MPSLYYGQDFRYKGDNNPHPGKAHKYKNLKDAKNCYAEFCADSDKFGFGEPGEYWLYKGLPDGDESTCGYPDFPDYVLFQGVKGGVSVSKPAV